MKTTLFRKIGRCSRRLFLKLYRLGESARGVPYAECDVIIPHGCGLTADGRLVNYNIGALKSAVSAARRFPNAPILLISTKAGEERHWEEERRIEQKLKIGFLVAGGVEKDRIISIDAGAENTVAEVREASWRLFDKKDLVVICDWVQSRSARIIWRHFCPDAVIHIEEFEAEWNGEHRAWLLKSPCRWIATNLVRHALLRLLGVERTGNFRQRFRPA